MPSSPASTRRGRRSRIGSAEPAGPSGRLPGLPGSRLPPGAPRALGGVRRRQLLGHRTTSRANRIATGRTTAADAASGRSSDAPAARACPPPPHVPQSAVASTPPGFVRTDTRVASSLSLKRIATSAVSDWARRSMIPSECAEMRAGRARSVELAASTRSPARRRGSRAGASTRPKSRELRFRLGPVEAARDLGERRARLHQRGRRPERPGVAFGCAKCRGVHDDARRSARRPAVPPDGQRHAEPRREERDHLAGRRCVRVDPVEVADASLVAWWSMSGAA